MKTTTATIALLLLGASPAWAEAEAPATPPAKPTITTSGLIFADYRIPLGGAQSFNVTRAFLTGKAQLNETWSGVVQFNGYPVTFLGGTPTAPAAKTESNEGIVQLAYFQAANLVPGMTFQLGMFPTLWLDYTNTLWRYRLLGLSPIEGGLANSLGLGGSTPYITTWDKGFKATGQYGPLTIAAAAMNGEGFRAPEGDGQKSFQGRLTYNPMPALDVTLLAHRGNPTGALQADRYAGMLVYHLPQVTAMLEGDMTTDVSAASATVNGRIVAGSLVWELPIPNISTQLILRANEIVANVDVPTANRLETLVGLGWEPMKGIDIVLDDQNITGATATAAADGNVVALHTAFGF